MRRDRERKLASLGWRTLRQSLVSFISVSPGLGLGPGPGLEKGFGNSVE